MAKRKSAPPGASAPEIPAKAPSVPPVGPRIANQEYVIAAVTSLREHPKNPKKGNVGAIGESIERNDFYGACVVQKSTGFILAGNHRWKGAIEKGLKEVPVIVVDCDDATAERILLADNRIADLGTYDDSRLMALAEERKKAGDLAGTGYVDVDLERMKAKLAAPPQFQSFDGAVKTKYKCPNCHFEW
jgi:hypothetical protein